MWWQIRKDAISGQLRSNKQGNPVPDQRVSNVCQLPLAWFLSSLWRWHFQCRVFWPVVSFQLEEEKKDTKSIAGCSILRSSWRPSGPRLRPAILSFVSPGYQGDRCVESRWMSVRRCVVITDGKRDARGTVNDGTFCAMGQLKEEENVRVESHYSLHGPKEKERRKTHYDVEPQNPQNPRIPPSFSTPNQSKAGSTCSFARSACFCWPVVHFSLAHLSANSQENWCLPRDDVL